MIKVITYIESFLIFISTDTYPRYAHETMADGGEENTAPPISDVGSVPVQTPSESDESDRWRKMFEVQNSNMRALIEALQ